jgi:hypothetical protein
MTAEFNWWLLLLGLVVGGGLTWLVLADTRRREQDLLDDELPEEAAWLEARMAEEGQPLSADTLQRVLQLHRAYLAIAPPDDVAEDAWQGDEPAPGSADPWQRPTHAAQDVSDDAVDSGVPHPPTKPDEPVVGHEVRGR